MRNTQWILCGLLPLLSAALLGCGTSVSEDLSTSDARIVLAAQGSSSRVTTMHVTATDVATDIVMLDKSVDVHGGSAVRINVALEATAYTIHLDATTAGDSPRIIGSAHAHADLEAGQTEVITLTANPDTGSVTVGVDSSPVVDSVE